MNILWSLFSLIVFIVACSIVITNPYIVIIITFEMNYLCAVLFVLSLSTRIISEFIGISVDRFFFHLVTLTFTSKFDRINHVNNLFVIILIQNESAKHFVNSVNTIEISIFKSALL